MGPAALSLSLVHMPPSPGLTQPLSPRPGRPVLGSGPCSVTLQNSVLPWASVSLVYSSESWVWSSVDRG